MMTIQKPKRQFQKKKAYLKRKLLNRFEGGKDQMSYKDWLQKAMIYKGIDDLKGYDYKGWYNEDPKRAYAFLNDDPEAHFDDKYKTVYHPTFSDQSIYSGVVHPVFNPQGLKGGKWVNDHKYISPRISPVSMDERIDYVNGAENDGVQIRTSEDEPLWVDDGTRYDGVLPQVIIKPKHNCGKDKFNNGVDDVVVDDQYHNSYVVSPSIAPVLTNDPNAVYVRPNVFVNNDTGEYTLEQNGQSSPLEVYDKSNTNDRSLWTYKLPDGRLVTPHKYGKQITITPTKEQELELTNPEFDILAGARMVNFSDIIKAIKRFKPINQKPKFKSELDWSPENWFGTRVDKAYDVEDITALQSHIPEYLKIEETAKKNGTWLKMPDGFTWEGDPRSWVQMMSKDYDRYTGKSPFKYKPFSHSTDTKFNTFDIRHFGKTDDGFYGRGFYTHPAENINGKLQGRNSYGDVDYLLTTDVQKPFDLRNPDFEHAGLYNWENTNAPKGIFDGYDSVYYGIPGENLVGSSPAELVVPKPTNYKSLFGNNGNFNNSNPNIYKSVSPIIIESLLSQDDYNSGKDIHIKKVNRGKFTEAANKHNMGVQEFANKVLNAPKGKYSSTLRKRANFARNFAH